MPKKIQVETGLQGNGKALQNKEKQQVTLKARKKKKQQHQQQQKTI